jgi:hypothetical protein
MMKNTNNQLNIKNTKMIDINLIPTKYQILFDLDNDWNKGNESKMPSLERAGMVQLWLEYNQWEIQSKLKLKGSKDEIEVLHQGFVKEQNDKQEIQGFIF